MKETARNMVRGTIVLGLMLLFCSTLVWAGGDQEGEAGKVVLSTYLQIDPANPQYEGHNAVMEAFAEAHPEIEFKHEYATGESFHQKFQAMAASGSMPDLFTTYVGKRTAYISETGKVLDLRSHLDNAFMNEFNQAAWEPQGSNGEIYTIPPSMAVCHVMYANMDILDELGIEFPETYQDLLNQVDTIRDAAYYPVSLGNRDQWPVNSWLLSALVDRTGGKEWFNKAMTGEASFTDKPFVDALAIVNEMVQKKVFSPGVNQMSNTEADQEFYQGKSAYLIDAGWRTSAMTTSLSEEFQNAVYMGVFPDISGAVNQGTSAAVPSEGFGLSSTLQESPEKLEAALTFLKFYNGEEGAAIRLKYGEIPTYKLDYSNYDLPRLQKAYADFQKTTEMGYVIDAKMDGEGMGILNPSIQAMMFGNITPAEVAAKYEAWVRENDSNRVGN